MNDQLKTLGNLPFHVAGRYPKTALIRRCQPDDITEISSREFFDRIRDLSLGLATLGVGREDRVALLSESRPEWMIADLAVLTSGAVSVPVYPDLPAAQVRYILADSVASAVFVSNEEQAEKVRSIWSDLPALLALIVIDPQPTLMAAVAANGKSELSLAEVLTRGHNRLMNEDGLGRLYRETAAAIDPYALATIIYTSGTTGEPKGVMLTHHNIVSNVLDVDTVLMVTDRDNALSFLPLSHALERTAVYLYLYKGVTINFSESLETIGRDLVRVRPSVMTGVPRVYEKLHARILEGVSGASAVRRGIFWWAMSVGLARARALLEGIQPPAIVRWQLGLADRLVFSKIRERTGGRLRFVVSGAAPLTQTVAKFLFAIGIPVVEGYGLTETAPVLTINPQNAPRLGTVGTNLPHVELRIAGDGEILARGPNLMQGYYRKERATAEVIKDGWLYTGDIGSLDADGYLRITDRKKDLIVTAGGKNVAPQLIEQNIKRHPLVAEVVLIGDRRPFISALLVPDFEVIGRHVPSVLDVNRDEIVQRADVVALYDAVIQDVNAKLARYEQVRKFVLLPAQFTVVGGELTPTLKVKRRVVGEKWKAVIEGLYQT